MKNLSGKNLLIIGVFLALNSVFRAQTVETAPNFEVQKIADDIYAVIRKEPPSLWFNPNTVFIIGKNYVTVVDTNISSGYTKEVLTELKKLML